MTVLFQYKALAIIPIEFPLVRAIDRIEGNGKPYASTAHIHGFHPSATDRWGRTAAVLRGDIRDVDLKGMEMLL